MNRKYKVAVVGTGMMASIRTESFLATNRVELVGVASRKKSNADAVCAKWSCEFATDDYRDLDSVTTD